MNPRLRRDDGVGLVSDLTETDGAAKMPSFLVTPDLIRGPASSLPLHVSGTPAQGRGDGVIV